jgi:hypothetical protein
MALLAVDWDAMASRPLMAAMGFRWISAQPFTAVRPTRNPVNEPGPAATANTSIWSIRNGALDCSTSRSRKSLVEYGVSSRAEISAKTRLSLNNATLPARVLVSIAKISMQAFYRNPDEITR